MNKKIKISLNTETSALINPLQLNFDTAYIKQELLNNDLVWSIYNEQGEKLGYAASREVAFAVVMQNEFIGLSVH